MYGGFAGNPGGWQTGHAPGVPAPQSQMFGRPGFHPQQQQPQQPVVRHTPQEKARNLTGPHAAQWREYYKQQEQPQQPATFGQPQQPQQLQHTAQEQARNLTGAHAAQWREYYRKHPQQAGRAGAPGAPGAAAAATQGPANGHAPYGLQQGMPRRPSQPGQQFSGAQLQPQPQHSAQERQRNLTGPHAAQWRDYYQRQQQQPQQQQQQQAPSYASAAGRRPSFPNGAGGAGGAAQPNKQWAWGTTANNSSGAAAAVAGGGSGVSFTLSTGAQKTPRNQFGGEEPAAFHTAQGSQSHPAKKRKTQTSAGGGAAGQKDEPWPPSLKAYVARAFAQCNVPGVDADAARNRVETELKAKIVTATARGPLTRTDWNVEPLPGIVPYNNTHRGAGAATAAMGAGAPAHAAGYGVRGSGGGPAVDGPKAIPHKNYICKICKKKGHFIYDCSNYFGKGPSEKQKAAAEKQQKTPAKKLTKKQAKAKAKAEREAAAAVSIEQLGYGDAASAASRAARFGGGGGGGGGGGKKMKRIKWDNADRVQLAASGPVSGTCTQLEKGYLRLVPGMEPDPGDVRPLPVLEKAFEHIVSRWKKEQKYKWVWAQLKSIRQDMSVQHIRGEFTAKVYETHARIALEQKDTPEFTQCLGQLRDLYADGIKGSMKEFFCYRLLYTVFTHSHDEYLALYVEVSNGSYPFTVDDPHVKHAISVYESYALGNYHKLFTLYRDAPNMGGYLMDLYVERERKKAMLKITQAYRPTVPIEFLFKTLSFEDTAECKEFLVEQKLPLSAKDKTLLDCKPSFTALQAQKAAAAGSTAAWAK